MRRITICLIVVICILAARSFAEEGKEPPSNAFSIRFENDTFGGTDANYTNGISTALTQSGNGLLGKVWDVGGKVEGKRFATYELTQLQFTPSDLKLSDPDPRDRPYAGILYLGLATHLQTDDSLHSLKLMAGVVGKASYAEGLQKFTHRVLSYTMPEGWSHQLKNEPILNLLYEYRHRFSLTPPKNDFGVELLPMGGAFLGNYLIQGEAELQCRFGYHLPDDFGTTVLRGIGYLPPPQNESKAWGLYFFAGGGANLVGRNLTLDGNTFADSRSVDKRVFLPAGEFGLSLWTRHVQTTFSYVLWGKEFDGQPDRENYGSVLLSYLF